MPTAYTYKLIINKVFNYAYIRVCVCVLKVPGKSVLVLSNEISDYVITEIISVLIQAPSFKTQQLRDIKTNGD